MLEPTIRYENRKYGALEGTVTVWNISKLVPFVAIIEDPECGVMAPNPVVITKLEFAIQPPNPSNPPFTIVLRARSGFGVSDGVSVRVGVALIVRVGVWLAVGIWVGRAVLVLVLVSVSVALGSGIAVLVAVFVGVWVFVWVGVSVNVALGTFVFVAVGRSVFVALGCAVLVAVNGAVADAVAGFLVAVSVRVRDFVGLLVGVRDFVRVLVAVLVRVATRPLFPAFPAACGRSMPRPRTC